MYDTEVKDQFVELRAQGKSFASISEALGVSKPTLIEWSREKSEELNNLTAINQEAMRERFRITKEHELSLLSQRLGEVKDELEKRTLDDISTDKLYGIFFKLIRELRGEQKPLELQATSFDLLEDAFSSIKKWQV